MAMLEVKNLEVYYGVIQAIKGISFEVNEGEVIALIGANGAGKTTTLQTITGMLQPKAGEISNLARQSATSKRPVLLLPAPLFAKKPDICFTD